MAETLDSLALVVRNGRIAKGWSQERSAKLAGVSRRQWAALEHGDNVSVAFLSKVIDVLELPNVPIGSKGGRAVPVAEIVDAIQLFILADAIDGHVNDLRTFAVSLLVPASQEHRSDIAAIEKYVRDRATTKGVNPATSEKWSDALRHFASEVLSIDRPELPERVAGTAADRRKRK